MREYTTPRSPTATETTSIRIPSRPFVNATSTFREQVQPATCLPTKPTTWREIDDETLRNADGFRHAIAGRRIVRADPCAGHDRLRHPGAEHALAPAFHQPCR